MYRKIIGIYRNFDGKLLNSCLATVLEVFLVLIGERMMMKVIMKRMMGMIRMKINDT